MIRIRSKHHNFRRCGMAHPKEPREYPDDRFTGEELAILKAEPMLTVEVIETEDSKLEDRAAEIEKRIEDDTTAEEKQEPVESTPETVEAELNQRTIVEAGRAAIEAGQVTKAGKPLVEAIEEILGRNITQAERDEAFEKLTADS